MSYFGILFRLKELKLLGPVRNSDVHKDLSYSQNVESDDAYWGEWHFALLVGSRTPEEILYEITVVTRYSTIITFSNLMNTKIGTAFFHTKLILPNSEHNPGAIQLLGWCELSREFISENLSQIQEWPLNFTAIFILRINCLLAKEEDKQNFNTIINNLIHWRKKNPNTMKKLV